MKTDSPMTKSPRAVAREALRLAQNALPAYSSKYSRKDFTQHQLFAVLALKAFLKTDYRGVVAFLADLAELRGDLGLSKVPDQSTLCKAQQRLLKTHIPHPSEQVSPEGVAAVDPPTTAGLCSRSPGGLTVDARTRFRTQLVGALPAVVHYFDELDLAATIDGLVPWEGEVPLGTLVEVLVANRLLQPKALFRIGPWAQSAALTDYYGLTPEQLNDDRLGRALERLAAHAETIRAALVLAAIDRFGLDVTQVHYDLTTVELYGAYEATGAQPPPAPRPTYGRTKSGRKHVKQVQLGLDVTGDGGVPVGHL